MPARNDSETNREIDRLFQLPLQQFTAARNALVARLKKAGRDEEARRVGRVGKPSVSAWTVNQLYWRYRQDFSRLLETGDRFRDAQQGQLAGKGTGLRGALEARREALSSLLTRAPKVLRDAGHDATPEVMRRITTTLEALATYGTLTDAPAAGRLIRDLQPLGFETLAALVPRPGNGRKRLTAPRVLPFSKKREAKEPGATGRTSAKREREAEVAAQRQAARRAVEAAERTLRTARKTVQRARAAFKSAAAHAKTTQRAKEKAEKRFETTAAAAEQASKEAHRIAREAEDAAQAVTDAEREVERARQLLKLPEPRT